MGSVGCGPRVWYSTSESPHIKVNAFAMCISVSLQRAPLGGGGKKEEVRCPAWGNGHDTLAGERAKDRESRDCFCFKV